MKKIKILTKKFLSITIILLNLAFFSSCSGNNEKYNIKNKKNPQVELTVVTSYGGDDGNRENYEKSYKSFEEKTGHIIKDESGTASEEWKAKIMADFETGAEPDVLFYFNGIDSNKLIEGNKVMSIEEVRKIYPDYASNMKDEMMGASPVDDKNYSVPVNGYWEGLYVNKKVLSDVGIDIPDKNYTWDEFLADCEEIKNAGYTPIAVSLQEIPHYLFEFTVFNNGNSKTHNNIPLSPYDKTSKAWANGLNDIKELYNLGYLPVNTTTALDTETSQLIIDDKAAFLIDGSWKLGWFLENSKDIDNFKVTYVPAKGERKANEIIGGLSMGYFITTKAWNNPEKRKVAVDFITAMTSDEVISEFGTASITALKNNPSPPVETNTLINSAIEMTKNAISIIPAVQDQLDLEVRSRLFFNIKNIVVDNITLEKVIEDIISKEETQDVFT